MLLRQGGALLGCAALRKVRHGRGDKGHVQAAVARTCAFGVRMGGCLGVTVLTLVTLVTFVRGVCFIALEVVLTVVLMVILMAVSRRKHHRLGKRRLGLRNRHQGDFTLGVNLPRAWQGGGRRQPLQGQGPQQHTDDGAAPKRSFQGGHARQ